MDEVSIFLEALKKPAPDERAAFLDQACGSNQELRHSVELLLRAHDKAGGFLAPPSPPLGATVEQSTNESAGAVIGPYKLMQQIGEGGMGQVFVAEQQHPLRRKVALKIIKPGMDSAQVLARFEAERQALALMDHQNIAKVYDAGATESGRPYFVMELIHGVPITEYCDANKLTPRQRLELFVPVCQAIQHAHQKGIIHRDIKPSNILVTMYDDKPVPKVIDFGVAKAVEHRLTDKTVYTQFGTLVGTFEYMSPEQAEMNAFGVDTRSDIYALGVLLYELLTGTTPLDRPQLRDAAFGEIVRRIREEDPPRPSVRLSTSGSLVKVAAERKTDPGKLSRLVQGELDWVVMRCLEKDRTRRYDAASSLARDVERYLNDEPVEARPPSAWYRFRKLARRNRVALTTTVLVAVALVAGTAAATWQAVRATYAEHTADAATQDAKDQLHRAIIAEERSRDEAKKAQAEAAIAKAVNEFVRSDLFGGKDPQVGRRGWDVKIELKHELDRVAKDIETRYPDQPLVEAAVRMVLGEGYSRALRDGDASDNFERAYHLRRAELGESHVDTLAAVKRAVAQYFLQGEDRRVKAEPLVLEWLGLCQRHLGEAHPDTLDAMERLASIHQAKAEYAKEEALLERMVALRRRTLGNAHSPDWIILARLATVYQAMRKYDEAQAILLDLLGQARKTGHDNDPAAKAWNVALAQCNVALGKHEQAVEILLPLREWISKPISEGKSKAVGSSIEERIYTSYYPNYLDILAQAYLGLRDYAVAERELRESLKIRMSREFGNGRPQDRVNCRSLLGASLVGQKKYAEAEPLLMHAYEESFSLARNVSSRDWLADFDRNRAETVQRLVQLYDAWGKPVEAAKWRKELEQNKK